MDTLRKTTGRSKSKTKVPGRPSVKWRTNHSLEEKSFGSFVVKCITLPRGAGRGLCVLGWGWGQDSTFALGFLGHGVEESRFLLARGE